MFSEEQRWESVMTDDAELILVAYGISSRVCKTAVRECARRRHKARTHPPHNRVALPQEGV